MKKIFIILALSLLLVWSTAFAAEDQNIVNPNSDLYDTSRVIEDTEYELTEENSEKALLQDEYADERLSEVEAVVEEGDEEKANELMEDYNEHLLEINRNIEEAKEAGDDITEVEKIIAENSQKRSENLTALLEREDLPEEAKKGITKALENQKMAQQKFSEALKKAEEARGSAMKKQEEAMNNAMNKAEEAKKGNNLKKEDSQQTVKPKESEESKPDIAETNEQKPEDKEKGTSGRP